MLRQAVEDKTRFLDSISCHAFNKDRTQVAICPNSHVIDIYDCSAGGQPSTWKKLHSIAEHSGLVSDMDWNHETNQIVSCGHDRNAYVWNLVNGEWKPTLCVLRINRAAVSVKWSPNGKKFAVTSASRAVQVCYYEQASDWWVSRSIRKHKSTIVHCAWSPNSRFLITASTDYRCRIVSAYHDGIDTPDSDYDHVFGEKQYVHGEVLAEFEDAKAWVNCVAWSPNGQRVAFFGHSSSAHFVDLAKGLNEVQTIHDTHLPMLQAYFLNDDTVVAAGFDCNPCVYVNKDGQWKFKEFFQKEGDAKAGATPAASGVSAAFARFQQADSTGSNFGAEKKKASFKTHTGTITCVKLAGGTKFTTSGVDGRLETWDAQKFL